MQISTMIGKIYNDAKFHNDWEDRQKWERSTMTRKIDNDQKYLQFTERSTMIRNNNNDEEDR